MMIYHHLLYSPTTCKRFISSGMKRLQQTSSSRWRSSKPMQKGWRMWKKVFRIFRRKSGEKSSFWIKCVFFLHHYCNTILVLWCIQECDVFKSLLTLPFFFTVQFYHGRTRSRAPTRSSPTSWWCSTWSCGPCPFCPCSFSSFIGSTEKLAPRQVGKILSTVSCVWCSI